MTLDKKISLAKEIRSLVTAHPIWQGMSPFPFILYDENNQVAVGENFPPRFTKTDENIWVAEGADPLLLGNTATKYHNQLVAIWDTRTWDAAVNHLSAATGLAHEMFHCHQLQSMSLSWANELLFPQYPHTPRTVALVMEENTTLAKILENPKTGLSQLIALRNMRKTETPPEFLEFDKQDETIEGTATYVEQRLLSRLKNVPLQALLQPKVQLLIQDENVPANYRHRLYTVGAALCFAASALYPNWEQEWETSGLTLYDWLEAKHGSAESVIAFPSQNMEKAARQLEAFEQEKQRHIDAFMELSHTGVDGDVQILSFDPMNLVCAGGKCLHKHGLLRINGEDTMLDHSFVVEYGESILDVRRLYMPTV